MLPILLVLLITNFISTTLSLPCKDNEVEDSCPSNCPSDYCLTSSDQDLTCTTSDECPLPVCKCRFNYSRAANNTCIPTKECPPFECTKPYEEYNPCPPLCPTDSCSQASPTGECPPLGETKINLQCRPKCRCVKGYWRLNGTCVPYEQCLSAREGQ